MIERNSDTIVGKCIVKGALVVVSSIGQEDTHQKLAHCRRREYDMVKPSILLSLHLKGLNKYNCTHVCLFIDVGGIS